MNLSGVSAERLPEVWEDVKPLIVAACSRSFPKMTEADVLKAVSERDMQLWVIYEDVIYAVLVTEILNYPLRRVCRILMATGTDRTRWQHFISDIERWAKEQGCDSMELEARPGWKRVFTDYKFTHVHLEKNLHGNNH